MNNVKAVIEKLSANPTAPAEESLKIEVYDGVWKWYSYRHGDATGHESNGFKTKAAALAAKRAYVNGVGWLVDGKVLRHWKYTGEYA